MQRAGETFGRRFSAMALAGLLLPLGGVKAQTGVAVLPALRNAEAAVSLSIQRSWPETVVAGEPLQYSLVARNAGRGRAFGVRVEDRLSAEAAVLSSQPAAKVHGDRLQWDLGDLDAGEERRIVVQLQPKTEGELRGQATITGSSTCELRTQVLVPRLTLQAGVPEKVAAGEPVVVNFQVANATGKRLTNVVLMNRLSVGLKHPQGDAIEADIGSLGAGEVKTLTLRVMPSAVGQHTIEAAAISKEGLSARTKAVIAVAEKPVVDQPVAEQASTPQKLKESVTQTGLRLQVKDREDPIDVGGETLYEITVKNLGSAPVMGVRLMAILPQGMTYVGASGPTGHRTLQQHVLFQPLAKLAEKSETNYVLCVRGRTPGTWHLKALVTTDQSPQPVQVEESTRIRGP